MYLANLLWKQALRFQNPWDISGLHEPVLIHLLPAPTHFGDPEDLPLHVSTWLRADMIASMIGPAVAECLRELPM